MKRLQRYYYLVGIPVLLLVLGTIYFYPAIVRTVKGNPHPQINYVIFVLIVVGCVVMLDHIRRINREGLVLREFFDIMKKNAPGQIQVARNWLQDVGKNSQSDVTDVLELVLDTHGKALGPVQHAAIESEMAHLQARQQRRLLLAQFLSGMMVGMGLLGTFIGLLGALEEIGKLIGSFSMGPGMSDPVAAVSELVARLTEPMKAMGVAFSASLFGVLGSLVMSMLLVFVRSASAELLSMVQSRVSWLTELGTNEAQNGLTDVEPIQNALSQLAQQSPMLQGMVMALDQSERRVRQLLGAMSELTAQILQGAQTQDQALQAQNQHNQQLQSIASMLQQLRAEQQQTLQVQQRAEQRYEQGIQVLLQLQAQMHETLSRQEPVREVLLQLQKSQAEQAQAQLQMWQSGLQASQQQVLQEREQWLARLDGWGAQQQQGQQYLQQWLHRQEQMQAQQGVQWQQLQETLQNEKNTWNDTLGAQAELLQQATLQLRSDGQQRTELAQKIRLWLDEQQLRQEQLAQALLTHLPPPAAAAST